MLRHLSCALIGAALAIDGDTLQILPADASDPGQPPSAETATEPGCRVRLWGVDAVELHEAGGQEARDALATMLLGATVDCTDQRGRSYGRRVARCLMSDRADVAEQLVRRGWAVDSPAYSQGHYAPAEAAARAAGRGMWGE